MAIVTKHKSLAQQIAELDDPAPRDYDPEDVDLYHPAESSEDESQGGEKADGREHYETVGKSKLRKLESVPLGPAYRGSRISRTAVEDSDDDRFLEENDSEDSDEDDAVEDDESEDETEESAGNFQAVFNTNGHHSEEDDSMADDSELNSEEREDAKDDNALSFDEESQSDSDDEESTLRKLGSLGVQSMTHTLSDAVSKDISKGNAIKSQRKAFDMLLNIRIKLQKALVAVNSLPEVEPVEDEQANGDSSSVSGALEAAVKLFNTISSARRSIKQSKGLSNGRKRKFTEIDSESPLHKVWIDEKEQDRQARKDHDTNLNFWSNKLPKAVEGSRLTNDNTPESLSEFLNGQFGSTKSHLIQKTKVPRSCAPLQAAQLTNNRNNSKPSTSNDSKLPIYDDADFYGLLLQSLITQRSSEASALSALNVSFPTQPWQAAREAKTKKIVDTKASKGRKLKYAVHEKLQDLMPREDRTSWSERQTDDLFASILGRRIELQDEESEEEDAVEEGIKDFRLF